MATIVSLCVIRDEMIVYKAYLGQIDTANSIRTLLGSGNLVPTDSWSELHLSYERYDSDDLQRNWGNIAKTSDGLQTLDNVPSDGTWGILYES